MCELASMASCREAMAAEDGVDGFEGGEKVLRLRWVLESLPLSFSNPRGLMGLYFDSSSTSIPEIVA